MIAAAVLSGVLVSAEPRSVVVLPAAGEVSPQLLADGTPVWVQQPTLGVIRVLEAVAPETSRTLAGTDGRGVVGLVAWCPRGERFVEGHHGASYSPEGRRYAARVPARLPREAPREGDLRLREVTGVGGARVAGDPVQVGGAQERAPLSEPPTPPLGGRRSFGPPGECVLPTRQLVESTPPLTAPAGMEPLDHSSLVGPWDPSVRDGWQLLAGALLVHGDGTAQWCAATPSGMPPACGSPSGPPVDLGLTAVDTAGAPAVLSGPVALRLEGGVAVQAGVMFDTIWQGSSLRGGETYDGMMAGFGMALGALLLQPPPDVDSDCLGQYRAPAGGEGAVQRAGLDTRFDVDGITDPAELEDAAQRLLGTSLRITVDSATCRALLVIAE